MPSTGKIVRLLRRSKTEIQGRVRRQSFSICFLFLFVLGCGYPERPKVVSLSSLETFRPSSPSEVKSLEQALAAIVTVCRDDLKLPVAESFQAYLYKNSQSFASFGVDWRAFPIDVGDVAAFADGTKIHVDLQKINDDDGPAAFTWVLAHEFGHIIHREVAGVIPKTDFWFNEGFAEWVAAKVFDALGWQEYRHSLHRVTTETSSHLEFLPRMFDLQDGQTWRRTMRATFGRVRTYSLALVAVERLVQRNSLASPVQLLSANVFNKSFGTSYNEFDRDLKDYLAGHRVQSNVFNIITPPLWKTGDKWLYEIRRSGHTTVSERELIRRDTFVGIPSYVVKSGAGESLYATDSLALVATKKNGRYTYRVSNIDRLISWPLQANKQWQNHFTREDAEVRTSRWANMLMRVVGFESVNVKAGILESVKIEAYGNRSGRLLGEYWYSPDAKWFAKSRIYDRDFGLVEEDLVSFRIQ